MEIRKIIALKPKTTETGDENKSDENKSDKDKSIVEKSIANFKISKDEVSAYRSSIRTPRSFHSDKLK